jgi:hypothetical protein
MMNYGFQVISGAQGPSALFSSSCIYERIDRYIGGKNIVGGVWDR